MELTFSIKQIVKTCNVPIIGVFHVGAAYGQEKECYHDNGINNIVWIEPLESQFKELVKRCPNDLCFQIALSDNTSVVPMYTTTKPDASSLLKPEKLLEFSKKKPGKVVNVKTTTMDELVAKEKIDITRYNLLVIDVQGSELMVINGGRQTIPKFDAIVIEVNDIETYKGCPTWEEVKHELLSLGFKIKNKVKINKGQSDVLCVRYNEF